MKNTGFGATALVALVGSLSLNGSPALAGHPQHGSSNLKPVPPSPAPPAPPALPAPMPASPTPQKLFGSFVYVYSFLDIREGEYSSKVLDQFDADLSARMSAFGVNSKILRYNKTKTSTDEFFAEKRGYGAESREVPVMQTVAGNLSDERAVSARFRLIVFPQSYTLMGAWRYYDIRFVLMDALTNRRVMDYVYSGKHMVVMKNSENAAARSKKIIDKLFEQFKLAGLV